MYDFSSFPTLLHIARRRRTKIMTIFVASTENDAARPKEQRQRRDHEAKNRNNNNSERKFPSWTKTQIPKWGTRICVPEWDDDEIIIDDDDDDDDD